LNENEDMRACQDERREVRTPRVAVLQDELGYDGRSRTSASIVAVLNDLGVEPDILSFSDSTRLAAFADLVPDPLRMHLRPVGQPRIAVGDMLRQLALVVRSRRALGSYDLAVAIDTAAPGFPSSVPLVRLVCYPRELVPALEDRYRRWPFNVYGVVSLLLYRVAHRLAPARHGTWLANSEFTRAAVAETYGVPESEITLVYAPADTNVTSGGKARARSVLSLAGFHPDKRQLEQIALARAFASEPVHFYIAGTQRSRSYLERCRREAENAKNVTLLPNAAPEAIAEQLQACAVFLHSKRFEHFGVSIVEAIAGGCVPIVHDSGGQREIVPFSELRYTTPGQAVMLIRRALNGEFDHLVPRLQAHISRYDESRFRAKMRPILQAQLGGQ
jgi:glycosyltransferase involved in cell wall biosynthesis